jgi:hypothetical protein
MPADGLIYAVQIQKKNLVKTQENSGVLTEKQKKSQKTRNTRLCSALLGSARLCSDLLARAQTVFKGARRAKPLQTS